MSSPNPIRAPAHIHALLTTLHKTSLDQEATLTPGSSKFISSDKLHDAEDILRPSAAGSEFDAQMLDKFIALDQDKCHFMYQLILATGATNIVEAGTSFGVSTIYLALGVGENKKALGKEGVVVATEKEPQKAEKARGYWKQCGEGVEGNIDLRVGDLLETLKTGLPDTVDLLLLDSEF